jgi:hypothetical protein
MPCEFVTGSETVSMASTCTTMIAQPRTTRSAPNDRCIRRTLRVRQHGGRWVFHAELAARECGNLTLAEALELVCLVTRRAEPAKFEKAALRWHARFVAESSPSLLRAQIALAALSELRVGSEPAKKVLFGLVGACLR